MLGHVQCWSRTAAAFFSFAFKADVETGAVAFVQKTVVDL